jgi:hypothetical protein
VTLTRIGTLPVAGLNVGIAAGLPVLTAQIAKLNFDIGKLNFAIADRLVVTSSLPINLSALSGTFAIHTANLAANLNPGSITVSAAPINIELAGDLAFIEAQLGIAGPVKAEFEAGLNAGGLASWSYRGSARGFGETLEQATRNGFGETAPGANVKALIAATPNPATWSALSLGFNTGRSGASAARNDEAVLEFLGSLSGGQLNTGVLTLQQYVDLFWLSLEAQRLNLLAQLEFSVGLELPSVDLLLGFAADIDLGLALDNLLNVQLDLTADITALTAQIDVLASLIADFQVQLSADGLYAWSYDGPASGLGAALKTDIAAGIPGGGGPEEPAYGIVLACESPAVWSAFSLIFGA